MSDRVDRRTVLIAFAAIGAVAEVLLALGSTLPFGLVCGLGFAVGGTTMVLYTLAVSHANDRAGPEHAVSVSSGLLFLYCGGAIVAPVIASTFMARFGAQALFWQNAVTHAGLAAFALWRVGVRRRAVPLQPGSALRRVEPGRG